MPILMESDFNFLLFFCKLNFKRTEIMQTFFGLEKMASILIEFISTVEQNLILN